MEPSSNSVPRSSTRRTFVQASLLSSTCDVRSLAYGCRDRNPTSAEAARDLEATVYQDPEPMDPRVRLAIMDIRFVLYGPPAVVRDVCEEPGEEPKPDRDPEPPKASVEQRREPRRLRRPPGPGLRRDVAVTNPRGHINAARALQAAQDLCGEEPKHETESERCVQDAASRSPSTVRPNSAHSQHEVSSQDGTESDTSDETQPDSTSVKLRSLEIGAEGGEEDPANVTDVRPRDILRSSENVAIGEEGDPATDVRSKDDPPCVNLDMAPLVRALDVAETSRSHDQVINDLPKPKSTSDQHVKSDAGLGSSSQKDDAVPNGNAVARANLKKVQQLKSSAKKGPKDARNRNEVTKINLAGVDLEIRPPKEGVVDKQKCHKNARNALRKADKAFNKTR